MNGLMPIFKSARFVLFSLCVLYAFMPLARAEMPEIKISDAQMVQMPHFRFILPNSAVELSIHQQISSTTIDVSSKYDILDSFFRIGFDLRYNFAPYFAGANIKDSIFFEQNYGPKTYFQRVRGVGPYFGYNLGRFTEVKGAIGIDNTLTASVDKNVELDKGTNVMESVGVRYDTTDELNPVPNGTMFSAKFYGSFRGLVSDYEYTKGEVDIKNTYMPQHKDYLESYFKYYFPVNTVWKPLSDVYFVGGYDTLRGYNYMEFFGDTLKYAKLNYHIPIVRNVKKKELRAAFQILTVDITGEAVQIGNGGDLDNANSLKSSVSFGLGCDVVLFEHVNLKFDTFAGKALEPRMPVLYFILTAYTYFWI